ncbi:MAG: cyclic nucleotide-binding domain-containing protein, partial [Bdellovibrionales bacterium]|nr:cyclic nucleotide-binding domain-containing protein [Bdellovibrionales bacterium]
MGLEKELLSFSATGTDAEFPEDLAPWIRLLLQSKTIEEAILTAQAPNPRTQNIGLSQGGFSYSDLYESLRWLRDNRILKNKSIQHFIDNSQAEYIWPRSLLKFPLLEFVVWQNSNIKKPTSIGFTPWVLLFPLLLILTGIVWSLFKSLIPLSSAATSTAPLYSFLLIVFTVSFLRTAQAIAVSITHELLGLSQSLKWVLTPLSMHLEVSDRSHPKVQRLLARAQIMIAALSPLIFWTFAARSGATPTLFFATCIWLLCEFSPLTQSELTLGLKDLFSVTPSKSQNLFQLLHKALVVFWISAVGTFLVFSLQGQIFPRLNAFLGSTTDSVPSFFFLIFLAYFIFAILDEILQGSGITDQSTTTTLRRIFRAESPTDRVSKFSAITKNLDSFSALPIIQFFPAEAQAHFHSTSQLLRIKKGTRVCQQGETSRDLFILLDGSLKIFRQVAGNGKDYLARIAPISVFGEMSFFLGVPRTASVMAEEDSIVLKIPHSTKLPDLDTKRMLPIRNTIWALQAMSHNAALSKLPSETLSLL